jgi:hypothetical protein
MNTLLIAVLALSGSPLGGEDSTAVSAKPQAAMARTGNALRDAVQDAIRRWGRVRAQELRPAAKELLPLYLELQHDKELTPSVREELRAKVRRRLLDIAAQLRVRPAESVAIPGDRDRPLAQRALNSPVNRAAGNNGSGQDDNGADLADLIQQVVSPQTWEANGGRGSIYYWPPSHAMVIRQTQDVHDEIGEVLLQLRRAGQ